MFVPVESDFRWLLQVHWLDTLSYLVKSPARHLFSLTLSHCKSANLKLESWVFVLGWITSLYFCCISRHHIKRLLFPLMLVGADCRFGLSSHNSSDNVGYEWKCLSVFSFYRALSMRWLHRMTFYSPPCTVSEEASWDHYFGHQFSR